MKKNKVDNENYLDFIPERNPEFHWSVNDKQMVVVHIHHRGFYAKLAHKVFHRPDVSHIDLDDYGSFIWNYIDGAHTIHDISVLVKENFGEKAEPLLNRLVKYFQILYDNKFIVYQGRKSK